MPSFTHRIPNLQQVGPIIELMVTPSIPFLHSMGISQSAMKWIKTAAMIDTGASTTIISHGLANLLQINPIGLTNIHTPSSTDVSCYQFDVQIIFPNNINIASIVVTEAPLKGQHIQCLIGRDVLQSAVLIYTGYDNSFTLSF